MLRFVAVPNLFIAFFKCHSFFAYHGILLPKLACGKGGGRTYAFSFTMAAFAPDFLAKFR